MESRIIDHSDEDLFDHSSHIAFRDTDGNKMYACIERGMEDMDCVLVYAAYLPTKPSDLNWVIDDPKKLQGLNDCCDTSYDAEMDLENDETLAFLFISDVADYFGPYNIDGSPLNYTIDEFHEWITELQGEKDYAG